MATLVALGPARTHVAHVWGGDGYTRCGLYAVWGTFNVRGAYRRCRSCQR